MRVARLNAKTTILVSDRVKWIDSVQSNIATLAALVERTEFLAKSMSIIQAKYPTMTDKQSEEFARMLKEHEEKTFERNRMAALLGLSLDISPEKRHTLFRAIERYAAAVPGISTNSGELLVALNEVQRITSEILEQERAWVRQQVSK